MDNLKYRALPRSRLTWNCNRRTSISHHTRRPSPHSPFEMHLLFVLLLRAFHFIYPIVVGVRCFWPRSSTPPQATQSPRHRIPKHLAIVFVINESLSQEIAQNVLCKSVINAVEWCQSIGIKKLTVYDERGGPS